jgi:DNA-binding MarR family transcriptional regulator
MRLCARLGARVAHTRKLRHEVTPPNDPEQVLVIMACNRSSTILQSEMLEKLGWTRGDGAPDWIRLKRALKNLQKKGYIDRVE